MTRAEVIQWGHEQVRRWRAQAERAEHVAATFREDAELVDRAITAATCREAAARYEIEAEYAAGRAEALSVLLDIAEGKPCP